jgi:hypothetical protein
MQLIIILWIRSAATKKSIPVPIKKIRGEQK